MSTEDTVMAQAIKTFQGEEGFKNPQSEPFLVSRPRFADLKANGLVVEAGDAEPAPQQVEQPADQSDAKSTRTARAK